MPLSNVLSPSRVETREEPAQEIVSSLAEGRERGAGEQSNPVCPPIWGRQTGYKTERGGGKKGRSSSAPPASPPLLLIQVSGERLPLSAWDAAASVPTRGGI